MKTIPQLLAKTNTASLSIMLGLTLLSPASSFAKSNGFFGAKGLGAIQSAVNTAISVSEIARASNAKTVDNSTQKSSYNNSRANSQPNRGAGMVAGVATEKPRLAVPAAFSSLKVDVQPISDSIEFLQSIVNSGTRMQSAMARGFVSAEIDIGEKWYRDQKARISALPNINPQKAEALKAIEQNYKVFCQLRDKVLQDYT